MLNLEALKRKSGCSTCVISLNDDSVKHNATTFDVDVTESEWVSKLIVKIAGDHVEPVEVNWEAEKPIEVVLEAEESPEVLGRVKRQRSAIRHLKKRREKEQESSGLPAGESDN